MRKLLLALLISFACALPALAHWADLAVAEITAQGRTVEMTLTVPTGLLGPVDDDRDGHLSATELAAHRRAITELLSKNITVEGATLTSVEVLDTVPSTAAAAPTTSHSTLALKWSAPQPLAPLHIRYDLMAPDAPSARCMATMSVDGNLDTFTFTQTQRDLRRGDAVAQPSAPPSTLQQLVSAGPTTGRMLAVALGVAFVLGALHGLSPGHGKTIVASYLVGSRGTIGQAMLLGFVVTFTHTISVILLGVLCLTVFQYGVPPSLFPWLGAASGLLVTAMGAYLMYATVRDARARARLQVRVVAAPAAGETSRPMVHARRSGVAVPRGAGVRTRAVQVHAMAHSHHGHAHDQDHSHDHDHAHRHDHGHTHVHSHGGRPHSHALPARITLWSLVALGVSGGLVPCPDALVVLLSAIAINKIALGLLVIVAFSCGLAAVLMAIGVVMVMAGKALDRWYPQRTFVRRLSMVSYAVIMVLGLGIAVQSLAGAGLLRLPGL